MLQCVGSQRLRQRLSDWTELNSKAKSPSHSPSFCLFSRSPGSTVQALPIISRLLWINHQQTMACDHVGPQTVFANKVVLEYHHNHLIYRLWLLLCYSG